MSELQNKANNTYKSSPDRDNKFDSVVKKKRRQKRKNRLVAILITALLAAVGIYFCHTELFVIKKVEVVDLQGSESVNLPYTDDELMTGLGLVKGMGLYEVSVDEMVRNAKYNLSYIKDIEISRKWPSTVVAKVEKEISRFYLSLDNKLYILSDSLEVLEADAGIETIEIDNLILLQVNGIKKCVKGEKLEIDNEDEKIILDISNLLFESGLGDVVTMLDVRDAFDIELMYDTRYLVKLGDSKDLGNKLQMMKIIIEEKSDEIISGTIDVTADYGKTGTFEKFS